MNEDDPIVAEALRRGLLTPAQLEEARRLERELSLVGRSPGLRALLAQRFLRPEAVDLLRRTVAESSSGVVRSPGLGSSSSDVARPTGRMRELTPGMTVGGFVIERLLGRGGMGVVYAGHDPRGGVRAAIKVLLDTRSGEAYERFRREGIAQAAVDRHPNVLRIYAAGEHEGMPFLAMELAEGGDLAQRVAKGPLPLAEAARVTAQLARGLAHVHAQGILHRDLKPSNVLFDAAGTPKLVDFGLARLRDQQAMTRTGDLLGTPIFMAPEQADGQRHAVDERSDTYGLTAVFYTIVTGQRPFPGESVAEILRKVLIEEPARPSSLLPGLPPDVDRVVAKGMAKAPEDRYPTATALAEDLERLARGAAVQGRDPGARRRRRRAAAIGAGVTAAAAALAAVVGLALSRPPAPPEQPPAPTEAAAPARGALRAVHGDKAVTRLDQLTVEATVEGDALGGRVVVGDKVAAVTTDRAALPWRRQERVPLAPGRNVVALEGLRHDGSWARLATLQVERLTAFAPPPPREVVDRKGRRLVLDEAREQYVAHDGSVLVYVPPGRFSMGSEACVANHVVDGVLQKVRVSSPVHQVTLTRGLLLGRHEVSWAQLAAWIDAERPALARLPQRPARAGDDLPAVNVLWGQARAYCDWAGLELPTEAQWEWAARGPEARQFPWGDDPDPARVNVSRGAVPVTDDSFQGASWVGALHMAGNAWEWVEDLFTPGYDPVITLVGNTDPCNRGQGDAAPDDAFRILRGGSWIGVGSDGPPRWHSAFRFAVAGDLTGMTREGGPRVPAQLFNDIGFRVALTLDERALPSQ